MECQKCEECLECNATMLQLDSTCAMHLEFEVQMSWSNTATVACNRLRSLSSEPLADIAKPGVMNISQSVLIKEHMLYT